MKLKIAVYILGIILLPMLTSCLGGNDNPEVIYSPDAQITSFSITGDIILPDNDTIKNGLNAIKFSINQINGEIFNKDSARYGLILPDSVPVTYATAGGSYLLNITDGDSVWIQSGDSIDLRRPILVRSYAATGDAKEYMIKLNIHQIDPDVIPWQQVNSNLDFLDGESKTFMFGDSVYYFTKPSVTGLPDVVVLHISPDQGNSWEDLVTVNLPGHVILSQIQLQENNLFVCTSSGELYTANISDNFINWEIETSEYPVKNVFGTIPGKNVLALAVEKDGAIVSATFDGSNWEYGNSLPSENFPRNNFSSIPYERTVTDKRLTITGGTPGTVWSTINGLDWARIGNLPSDIQGANVFMYDKMFYLLNGAVNDSTYNTSVYTSIDGCVTWQTASSKTFLPEGYTFRENASVVVSPGNDIYIVGGRNKNGAVTDIWKGKLNRLNN